MSGFFGVLEYPTQKSGNRKYKPGDCGKSDNIRKVDCDGIESFWLDIAALQKLLGNRSEKCG
jgi:hypothetical protein